MKKLLLYGTLLTVLWCCKGKDQQKAPAEVVETKEWMQWKESDTLQFSAVPEGLADWLSYYQRSDPRFSLGHFKSSGVVLHFDGLPDAILKGEEKQFEKLFRYSPDSASYIDMFSYDHFMDKGTMTDGEADQQVVLANRSTGSRKQLLFNGPSQSVDFADWIGANSFILGMTAVSDDGKTLISQLLVFRVSDSSFTNFDLDHRIVMDSLVPSPQGFNEMYIQKLQGK